MTLMSMMSFDSIIRNRRSIRTYKPEKPDEALIHEMLSAACHVPSPSHSQPVRYLRVESDDLKTRIKKAMTEGRDRMLEKLAAMNTPDKKTTRVINTYFRFSEFMFNAPCLFAVGTTGYTTFSDRLIQAGVLDRNPKGYSDADITTGLSLSAFILKGTELGIATCIISAPFVFVPGLSSKFSPDIRVTCFVTAGFADETPAKLSRITPEELCRRL